MGTTITMSGVGFGHVLDVLRKGGKASRRGWNGKDMFIQIQTPSPTSKMTLPYIFMKTAGGDLVPWLASQTDLLSVDWELLP